MFEALCCENGISRFDTRRCALFQSCSVPDEIDKLDWSLIPEENLFQKKFRCIYDYVSEYPESKQKKELSGNPDAKVRHVSG